MIELLLGIALTSAIPLGLRVATDLFVDQPGFRRGLPAIIGVAAVLSVAALAIGRGPVAALLTLPWWLLTVAVALVATRMLVRDLMARRVLGDPWRLGAAVAGGFLAVGATWLVLDRAAVQPFGFDRTIVLLTAVHFQVAGFVLTLAGALAARRHPGKVIHAVLAALVMGMPLTALGFFGFPLLSWIGALLVAIGGIGIGLATVAISRSVTDPVARASLLIGGATLFLTMPLAAAYATGTTFAIGFLDIPAMAAIHGGLNIVGFAIPAMFGWWRIERRRS